MCLSRVGQFSYVMAHDMRLGSSFLFSPHVAAVMGLLVLTDFLGFALCLTAKMNDAIANIKRVLRADAKYGMKIAITPTPG